MSQFKHKDLLPPFWRDIIRQYLRDDCPSFDVQGYVVGEKIEEAVLYCKNPCIVSGVPFFNAVFEELGCEVSWNIEEGSEVLPNQLPFSAATVRGKVRMILLGERTALNILSRASGISTEASELSKIAKSLKWHGEVAGTRKTTPGFRLVEKYALLVGGVSTHRIDLSQMVMLKDNHVWSSGSITNAVKAAKSVGGFSTKVEVEVRTLEEGIEAGSAGADIVMLDNYTPERAFKDAAVLKQKFPSMLIEGSGGITKETISSFFSPHIDVLSLGSLTHGYHVIDFSLKIKRS
jgi:nicotinate-nucleotide pyrophosphorylase (carboxylating)